MAFDNVVRLISGGTSYYLSGITAPAYTGSGTPWTAEATTPYKLSLNDRTPIWVPQPAAGVPIYGGGPPFRSGRSLIEKSYDNVTESVGVQMYATSADNVAALLRQLRQILNTATYNTPCVLAIQTGTNTAYYEIYSADVVEISSYLVEGPSTRNVIRATITWVRSFAGGLLSTGETLLNSASFENEGTGSPDNIVAYSAGSGDLIYEGQPLNIQFLPTFGGATAVYRMFLASVSNRLYTTTGATSTSTSTTGDGTSFATPFDTQAITEVLTTKVKPRILVRLASSGSNLQLRFVVFLGDGDDALIYRSAWVSPPGTGATLVDLGTFPTDVFRRSRSMTTPKVYILLYIRSTNGASAAVNLTYTEMLFYYDFARIDSSGFTVNGSTDYVLVDQFAEQTNFVCLPFATPRVVGIRTAVSGSPVALLSHRGTLPRYFSGASLYAAWLTSSSYTHTTTAAAAITATHAPLYHTLRGSG